MLEPALWEADSLQVLFYEDPQGDSLRYSRFFTVSSTRNHAVINALLNDLQEQPLGLEKARACRSEGKIYLFLKDEPLKTIYFSGNGKGCIYLYFIKNGLFYYFTLSPELYELINDLR